MESQRKLQGLRSTLYQSVKNAKGNLTDECVVRISQALDLAINQAMTGSLKPSSTTRDRSTPNRDGV